MGTQEGLIVIGGSRREWFDTAKVVSNTLLLLALNISHCSFHSAVSASGKRKLLAFLGSTMKFWS